MKAKKLVVPFLTAALAVSSLAGCNSNNSRQESSSEVISTENESRAEQGDNGGTSKESEESEREPERDPEEEPSENPLLNALMNVVPAKHYDMISQEDATAITEFGVDVLKKSRENDSILVSPISIFSALGMVANGADNETLAQMEEVLGMSVDQINTYVKAYMNTLQENGANKVLLANSIWTNDSARYTFSQAVMDNIEKFYASELINTVFSQDTKDEINKWIEEHTDYMIKNALDDFSPDVMMVLVNTLVFDAKWEDAYEDDDLVEQIFTREDKREEKVEFMSKCEEIYLCDENTTGFIKYYKDSKYAFVGLLPEEGMSMTDYINSLSGEKIQNLLNNRRYGDVYTLIPEFTKDYHKELSDVLIDLGMSDAFGNADFSKFTEEENGLRIGQVIHQTHIEVNPKGTKAAAATIVEKYESAAVCEPISIYRVYLDRPFVYILLDCDQNLPLFIGTVEGIE